MTHLKIVYGGFYDFPEMFVAKWRNRLLVFDRTFDKAIDEYPDDYTVYELPTRLENELETNREIWTTPKDLGRLVGRIAAKDVPFDPSRRKSVDDSVFTILGIG